MYRRFLKAISSAIFTLALAIFVVVAVPAILQAQQTPPAKPNEPASSSKPSTQEAPSAQPSLGQEAIKEIKEKESDPTEAFKRSSAVQWIGRVTGLGTEGAYWVSMILNFLIVFGGLFLLLRKSLPAMFKNRTEMIQKRLEEARKASEEARRRLSEVEGRLSRLDVEITEMRREAEENSVAEEKRVLAGAEEERRRIVAAAEQEIAMAANAARRDLKSYATELAVDLAAKKIQVGKDADQTLVRDFTAHLGKDGN